MNSKYDIGQLFFIGSREPPTNDFILYDEIIEVRESEESEGGGG